MLPAASSHMSLGTQNVYADRVRFYVHFHRLRHPRELGPDHLSAFLTYLATGRDVAAAMQNPPRRAADADRGHGTNG